MSDQIQKTIAQKQARKDELIQLTIQTQQEIQEVEYELNILLEAQRIIPTIETPAQAEPIEEPTQEPAIPINRGRSKECSETLKPEYQAMKYGDIIKTILKTTDAATKRELIEKMAVEGKDTKKLENSLYCTLNRLLNDKEIKVNGTGTRRKFALMQKVVAC